MDHLRGQLAVVEQTNAQLSSQVAALTEELSKLRCSTDTGSKMNGETVVIKQERRDSSDSDTTLDDDTPAAGEGAAPSASVAADGKVCDPPKKPVPAT